MEMTESFFIGFAQGTRHKDFFTFSQLQDTAILHETGIFATVVVIVVVMVQ